ncbi:uncharacterized protein VTP21DRAFT_5547 [Calcarisporiella thermophila]|uniref:uncharacterized protein n=1 Tax=Calcarisporiella thermophila TaxID=911321 RepID=UPI003742D574
MAWWPQQLAGCAKEIGSIVEQVSSDSAPRNDQSGAFRFPFLPLPHNLALRIHPSGTALVVSIIPLTNNHPPNSP